MKAKIFLLFIFVVLLFISQLAIGQQINNVPWYQFTNKLTVKTKLQIPGDTTIVALADTNSIAIKNGVMYFLDTVAGQFKWQQVVGSGSAAGTSAADSLRSTSILSGSGIAINANPALFNINVKGQIRNPINGKIYFIEKIQTGVAITNIATQPVTYISIDSLGNIIQQAVPWSSLQRHTQLTGFVAVHSNNTSIELINNLFAQYYNPTNQLHAFMDAVGFLNVSGNQYFPGPAAGLTIKKTSGVVAKVGVAEQVPSFNPNQKLLAADSPIVFRYRNQNSAEGGNVSSIDPNNYDVAGTTTAVPANNFTIQVVAVFPSGVTRIQRGQKVYATKQDALLGIIYDPYNFEKNIAENGLVRCFLVVRQGEANFTNPNDFQFVAANKIGSAPAAGSGIASNVNYGVGLSVSGSVVSVDTVLMATRAWRQKGDDSLAAKITASTAIPANRVPFGTGTGLQSDANFLFTPPGNQLFLNYNSYKSSLKLGNELLFGSDGAGGREPAGIYSLGSGLLFSTNAASEFIRFSQGGQTNEIARFAPTTGNFLLGQTGDVGSPYRLQNAQNSFFRGHLLKRSLSDNPADFAFLVQSSDATSIPFKIDDIGQIYSTRYAVFNSGIGIGYGQSADIKTHPSGKIGFYGGSVDDGVDAYISRQTSGIISINNGFITNNGIGWMTENGAMRADVRGSNFIDGFMINRLGGSGPHGFQLFSNNSHVGKFQYNDATGNTELGNVTNNDLEFWAGNAARAKLTKAGNLLLGVSIATDYGFPLQVQGKAYAQEFLAPNFNSNTLQQQMYFTSYAPGNNSGVNIFTYELYNNGNAPASAETNVMLFKDNVSNNGLHVEGGGRYNLIKLAPVINSNAFGGGGQAHRGVYYAPTITALANGIQHNAFESTSGNWVIGGSANLNLNSNLGGENVSIFNKGSFANIGRIQVRPSGNINTYLSYELMPLGASSTQVGADLSLYNSDIINNPGNYSRLGFQATIPHNMIYSFAQGSGVANKILINATGVGTMESSNAFFNSDGTTQISNGTMYSGNKFQVNGNSYLAGDATLDGALITNHFGGVTNLNRYSKLYFSHYLDGDDAIQSGTFIQANSAFSQSVGYYIQGNASTETNIPGGTIGGLFSNENDFDGIALATFSNRQIIFVPNLGGTGVGNAIMTKDSDGLTYEIYSGNQATAGASENSAMTQFKSTTKGVIMPRMTKAERDAIASPAEGLMIWQTDSTPGLRLYQSGGWVRVTTAADP